MKWTRAGGYLLLEAIVAMAMLSVGIIAINASLREAVTMRAHADDFTKAGFLLQALVGPEQINYYYGERMEEGSAAESLGLPEDAYGRFGYKTAIEPVEMPLPELPADMPADMVEQLEALSKEQLFRVTVTVLWTRRGQTYERTASTLVLREKPWAPELVALQGAAPQ